MWQSGGGRGGGPKILLLVDSLRAYLNTVTQVWVFFFFKIAKLTIKRNEKFTSFY